MATFKDLHFEHGPMGKTASLRPMFPTLDQWAGGPDLIPKADTSGYPWG